MTAAPVSRHRILVAGLVLSLAANAVLGTLLFSPAVRRMGLVGTFKTAVALVADRPARELPGYYRNRLQQLEALPPLIGQIAFLGDSLTEGGAWADYFPGLPVRNWGISGDNTQMLARRLEPLIRQKPRRILLMIGVNDLEKGREGAEVLEGYQGILDQLQRALPKTEIRILSVLPVNPRFYGGRVRNADVIALNERIAAEAEKRGLGFTDLWPEFHSPEGGGLDPRYTYDGLHLNGAGYERWVELIREGIND